MSVVIFEILERIWKTKDVSLIDMKLEFGIRQDNGEIVLSDVIDNDSWRIWPSGDKRLMRDKQVYRNMDKLSTEGLENLKKNYRWVADKCMELNNLFVQSGASKCRAVVFMGSATDMPHCNKIKQPALSNTRCGLFRGNRILRSNLLLSCPVLFLGNQLLLQYLIFLLPDLLSVFSRMDLQERDQ